MELTSSTCKTQQLIRGNRFIYTPLPFPYLGFERLSLTQINSPNSHFIIEKTWAKRSTELSELLLPKLSLGNSTLQQFIFFLGRTSDGHINTGLDALLFRVNRRNTSASTLNPPSTLIKLQHMTLCEITNLHCQRFVLHPGLLFHYDREMKKASGRMIESVRGTLQCLKLVAFRRKCSVFQHCMPNESFASFFPTRWYPVQAGVASNSKWNANKWLMMKQYSNL